MVPHLVIFKVGKSTWPLWGMFIWACVKTPGLTWGHADICLVSQFPNVDVNRQQLPSLGTFCQSLGLPCAAYPFFFSAPRDFWMFFFTHISLLLLSPDEDGHQRYTLAGGFAVGILPKPHPVASKGQKARLGQR